MSLFPHHTSDPVCALCALKLAQAHPDLVAWYNTQVKPTFPQSHISWSFRNQAQQEDCVSDGKSNEQWPHSPHNQTPAMALDLFEINDQGLAVWDPSFFNDVNEMNVQRSVPINWGGSFITLHDYDHYELKAWTTSQNKSNIPNSAPTTPST